MYRTTTTEEVMKPVVRVHKNYECDRCEFKTYDNYSMRKHYEGHLCSKITNFDCFVEEFRGLDFGYVYLFESEEKARDFAKLRGKEVDWMGPGWYMLQEYHAEDSSFDGISVYIDKVVPLKSVIFEYEELLKHLKGINAPYMVEDANNQ